MKETTYELRTLNEILQVIPDSHVSTDPIDSNMVYLHVCLGRCSDTHVYGLSRSCINTYLGHTVCLKIHYDGFEIKRLDGRPHTWKWNLNCLDDLSKYSVKQQKIFRLKGLVNQV